MLRTKNKVPAEAFDMKFYITCHDMEFSNLLGAKISCWNVRLYNLSYMHHVTSYPPGAGRSAAAGKALSLQGSGEGVDP